MVPSFATLPAFSQLALMFSWEVQLTEEQKSRAWFTDGSAQYAGTTRKWTASALQPLSGTSLEDSGEGNPPIWQNFEQCTWLFTLLEKKNDQTGDYILIHGLWSMVRHHPHYLLLLTNKVFPFCPHDFIFYWPRDLNSKGKNAFTWKHNTNSTDSINSIELVMETVIQTFWTPYAS